MIRPHRNARESFDRLYGERDFDRPRTSRPYPSYPSLRCQFSAPVRYRAIRGPYHLSFQLEAPAVVWGPGGRYWAFLHDFTPEAVEEILADYREATIDRRAPTRGPR